VTTNRPPGLDELLGHVVDEIEKDAAELKRFREREPLVQALMRAVDNISPYDGKGLGPASTLLTELSDFGECCSSASETTPAAADETGISLEGNDPTR
jgi:hypothetical protein